MDAARLQKKKEEGGRFRRVRIPPQPPNGIRGLDERRHPDHDRPQRWQPLVLETAYGDDVGHGEASPAKAVQAAESRLFTVEVAKRMAG